MFSFIKKIFKPSFSRICAQGDIEAVKQYLADGADVNEMLEENGGYGSAPLHDAALEGHKEIVELLIAEGADVNAKYEYVGTPLDYIIGATGDHTLCKEFNHPEIADLLRKHVGKTGEELK
jgi:ankyrin repeat protein